MTKKFTKLHALGCILGIGFGVIGGYIVTSVSLNNLMLTLHNALLEMVK